MNPPKLRSSLLPFLAAWSSRLRAVVALTLLPLTVGAQENQAPTAPGEIMVSEVTAHSARISWAAATDPNGDPLEYLVSVRQRIEGVAQAWSSPQESVSTSVFWDGLSSGTVYDVQVQAWDGHVKGPAHLRELAFTTLTETLGNHAPSLPGLIEISEVGAHAARISWGTATDQDGDAVSYQVAVRKRLEGMVGEWWSPAITTGISLLWDGLQAETVYDVRVRASDRKSFSSWLIKESAFKTLTDPGAPTRAGEITVTNVTSSSARISWEPATGPAGTKLAYSVQVRARTNELVSAWRNAGETTNSWLIVTGLLPGTVYDVQVRAWANVVGGVWDVKEKAFKTLLLEQINHAPGIPGPLEITERTPFSVRIVWRAATDADGDPLMYFVCLRKRIEGVAQAWSEPRAVEAPAIFWEGLATNTVYDVRLRAWDGRLGSDWYLKESAFKTPTPGPSLSGFVQGTGSTGAAATSSLMVIWPNAIGAQVLETSGSALSTQWTQCQEVETDGAQTRSVVPMNSNAAFFRVR